MDRAFPVTATDESVSVIRRGVSHYRCVMSDTTADRAALEISPLEDVTFGAVVGNVQLRDVDDATFAALYDAWITHALLIFPDQFLTKDEQNAFARRLGELEFEARPISNIGRDGTVHSAPDDDVVKSLRGNEGWHFDSTYMPVQAKGAVFSAEIVPSGGADTGWADMRAAYEALDDETKDRIADLKAYHSLYYSQGRAGYLPKKKADGSYGMYGYHDMEPSLRPLVKVHPVTGRPNLLIGRHAYGIVGMDEDESVALLDRLADEACQPPPRVPPPLDRGRRRALGQPTTHAPRHPVRHDATRPHVAHPHRRRTPLRARPQPLTSALGGRAQRSAALAAALPGPCSSSQHSTKLVHSGIAGPWLGRPLARRWSGRPHRGTSRRRGRPWKRVQNRSRPTRPCGRTDRCCASSGWSWRRSTGATTVKPCSGCSRTEFRVDTFDGSAWVGLIPFEMRRVRLGASPPVPWLGTFLEINVRTYVVDELGRRAVWFFSLDVPRTAIVAVARAVFSLPYCWATTTHTRTGRPT